MDNTLVKLVDLLYRPLPRRPKRTPAAARVLAHKYLSNGEIEGLKLDYGHNWIVPAIERVEDIINREKLERELVEQNVTN